MFTLHRRSPSHARVLLVIITRALLAVAVASATVFGAGSPAAPTRLDRTNLLEFRNEQGVVVPVRSVGDWHRRRAEILAGAQAVMGRLPGPEKRVPLDVRIEEEKDFGAYVRRRISYQSEPSSRVPAYLFLPKAVAQGDTTTLRSGVLCLMGTSGHRHEDSPGFTGSAGNRNDAEVLATRGFVAISTPYPGLGFGTRSGLGIAHDPDLAALGYVSGTMKAIWDNIRALDVLASLPYVKRGGFATIGHSLGGHNSIYTAVFDERIRVVVASCGFDSYLEYGATAWERGKGWAQPRYMPRMMDYPRDEIPFDFHELIGALAPRAFFASAPVGDANFKWRSAARIVGSALSVYRLYGVPELIRIVHPDVAHDFPLEIREEAYAWIEKWLQ
jgi:dienelactone hydrolase